MSRYARVWAELMRLSWRHERRLTAGALAGIVGSVAAVAASAVAARYAVEATIAHRTGVAVATAAGAALAYALSLMLRHTVDDLVNLTFDRLGRLQLHGALYLDISTVEGIEHLERSDYLDRIALIRRTPGGVASWAWSILTAAARVAELAVMVLLLGTITPLLATLLVFAVAPVLCDRRGQRVVHDAEVATEESHRLQQELFDLSVQAGGGKDLRVSGASGEIAARQRAAWDEVAAGRYRAQVLASGWRLLGWLVFAAGFLGALGLVTYRTAHGAGSCRRPGADDPGREHPAPGDAGRGRRHHAHDRLGPTGAHVPVAARLRRGREWPPGRRPADAPGAADRPAADRCVLCVLRHGPGGADRRQHHHPGRHRGRGGGRVRVRQDDPGEAADPLLPAERGHDLG